MSAWASAESYAPDYTFSRRPHSKATLSKTFTPDDYNPILAEIELRPSWNSTDGHFFAQNYAELGVRATKDVSISYQQQFVNELSQYATTKTYPGFRFYDGYLRTKVNKIWKDPNSDTSFSYESRIYTPTDPDKYQQGMIFAARNYFKFTRQITSATSLLFMEVPILHMYNSDGTTTVDSTGKSKANANPIFENQVYLELDITPPKTGWALSFPIMLSSTRYRDYDASDSKSGAWVQWVEIYPEIDYTISKGVVLGVAYESGNILNVQTSTDPSVNPEVGSGTPQLVLRATF